MGDELSDQILRDVAAQGWELDVWGEKPVCQVLVVGPGPRSHRQVSPHIVGLEGVARWLDMVLPERRAEGGRSRFVGLPMKHGKVFVRRADAREVRDGEGDAFCSVLTDVGVMGVMMSADEVMELVEPGCDGHRSGELA